MSNQKTKEAIGTLKEDGQAGSDVPAVRTTGTALEAVDFGEDSGSGLENVTAEERTIPFFRILQGLSPEVQEGNPKYIPGARAGMFINTATGEVYNGKTGLEFIPVERDHNYPEWTPRAVGGGFVAMHQPDDELVLRLRAQFGKFGKLPNGVTKRNEQGQALDGTELTETYYLYGLFRPIGSTEDFTAGVAAFVSTQIKKYTTFINRVTGFKYLDPKTNTSKTPPLFGHRWIISSSLETNKKNQSNYGFVLSLFAKTVVDGNTVEDNKIKSLIPMKHPDYQMAVALRDAIKGGKKTADVSKAGYVPGADEGEEKDEVPM